MVETRSIVAGAAAYRWTSTGQSDYDLEASAKSEFGTTVTLYIADDYRDMLEEGQLDRAVKKYADFIPFAIYINDAKSAANVIDAPWHRSYPSEDARIAEYWTFAKRRFPDFPLAVC